MRVTKGFNAAEVHLLLIVTYMFYQDAAIFGLNSITPYLIMVYFLLNNLQSQNNQVLNYTGETSGRTQFGQ